MIQKAARRLRGHRSHRKWSKEGTKRWWWSEEQMGWTQLSSLLRGAQSFAAITASRTRLLRCIVTAIEMHLHLRNDGLL